MPVCYQDRKIIVFFYSSRYLGRITKTSFGGRHRFHYVMYWYILKNKIKNKDIRLSLLPFLLNKWRPNLSVC